MSGGVAEARVKGGKEVVGVERLGLGGYADVGLVGGTDRRVGRYGQDGDRDRGGLNWWEDTIANIILGMETNAPLASAPGLELHHPITSMLGGHGGQLERDIYWRSDRLFFY